jgi:hypothetical protein
VKWPDFVNYSANCFATSLHFTAIKFRLMTTDVMLFPIFVRQGRSRTRFKVGYINQTGNVVIDPKFDEGTNFYEELASVKVGNRWSIINFAGDFLIQSSKWGWCVPRGACQHLREGQVGNH